MHVLVTGAGGFVGQALVRRLLGADLDPRVEAGTPRPLQRLTAIDQRFGPFADAWRADPRVGLLEGDFADADTLQAAFAPGAPDWVFHLASVPGSLAEREQALGRRVNLMAPIALLEALARAAAGSATPPRVVFASSIAVYGALPPVGRVDESCPAHPALTYGAHKLMTETLLADFSRRGLLDGISLRLPGIVARPMSPTGHGSAFMSDLIRCLVAGLPYTCPVPSDAQAWWMSLPCCVGNLVHAARTRTLEERCVQLPVITATVQEVVAAIETQRGCAAEVRYQPDPDITRLFGRMPGLETPGARRVGFTDDGSLARLVARAMALDGTG